MQTNKSSYSLIYASAMFCMVNVCESLTSCRALSYRVTFKSLGFVVVMLRWTNGADVACAETRASLARCNFNGVGAIARLSGDLS
jgi:hypothetical protein